MALSTSLTSWLVATVLLAGSSPLPLETASIAAPASGRPSEGPETVPSDTPFNTLTPVIVPELAEFSFLRGEYDSLGGFQESYYYYEGRMWQRWETDFPQADENFVFRLTELTTISANLRSVTHRLSDPEIFRFPFLYLCDVGWMELDPSETANLRAYLLKGGFLWIDDFWGEGEWYNLERNLRRVLPDHNWREIPASHELFDTVFPLEEPPQIPARDFAIRGWPHDPPELHRAPATGLDKAHVRGWFDDRDRLMVLATLNTDTGDGWEREGYGEWYFQTYSTQAYALGVNVVVHALSH